MTVRTREVPICENPIFIIGAPRSGKTTLAWALAAHSELWTTAELQILPALFGDGRVERLVDRQHARPSPTWLSQQEVERDEFLAYMGLGLNALFTNRSEGKRWIDHTPGHTFMVDTLLAMFPGAFVVHAIRDGRLAVQAMTEVEENLSPERAKAMREGNFLPAWTTDFDEACKTWAASVAEGINVCARHPERALTVRLDDVISAPEVELKRLVEALGAGDESGPAESWNWQSQKHSAAELTASEQWEAWSSEQRDTFAAEAGEMLIASGLATAADLAARAPAGMED